MHVGDNIDCCKNGDSGFSQSDRRTSQWKELIKSLFSVTENHIYTSVEFVTCNKHSYVKSAYLYSNSRLRWGFQPNVYQSVAFFKRLHSRFQRCEM